MDDKLPAPLRDLLRQKLVDSWQQPLPQLTRRDTWIPRIPGKTLAVIGMRRSGKTSLLWQEVARRLEDERLLIHSPGVELGHLTLVSLDSALQACCARSAQ